MRYFVAFKLSYDFGLVRQTEIYSNSSYSRSDILEYSFKSREPILNLQRVLIGLLQQRDELQIDLDNCWLRTAKIARKNGLFQTAHSSLLNVNDSDQIDILMEKATWHARLVLCWYITLIFTFSLDQSFNKTKMGFEEISLTPTVAFDFPIYSNL